MGRSPVLRVFSSSVSNAKLTHQTPKYEPHEMFLMPKILAHCYNTVSNMRQYKQQLQKFILLFYLLFLSPHHRYLSLSVFSSMSSLSSLSSLFLFPQHADHQRPPPLNATDHLSSLFSFVFFSSSFFSFFLFSIHFFWLWFDGWVRMGKSPSTTQHYPPHTLRSPISDADLCVFFFCFCFSMVVVLCSAVVVLV